MPRTRALRPRGSRTTSSSRASVPPVSVPVTTVPAPLAANTRSTQRRGRPASVGAGAPASTASNIERTSSTPRPLMESTTTIGHPGNRSSISSRASNSVSSSTTSALVSATRPCRTSSRSRIWVCSTVCGFHPSLAATTSSATSTAPTPASMFFTKRTCPGTSTNPTTTPDGRSVNAKPRSMVSPRAFSSGKRSGSVPVSASTSDDFPWSTCPAVATTLIPATSDQHVEDALVVERIDRAQITYDASVLDARHDPRCPQSRRQRLGRRRLDRHTTRGNRQAGK